jgi:hypothetical protein
LKGLLYHQSITGTTKSLLHQFPRVNFANDADKPDTAIQEHNNTSLVNQNDRVLHSRQYVRHIHINKDNRKKQLRSGKGVTNEESATSGARGTATYKASDIYSSSSIGTGVYVNLLQLC